jgi:hypothetical protein
MSFEFSKIGLHLVNLHQASSNERSSGEGNQSDGADISSFRFPAFEFPAFECHGSFLSMSQTFVSMPGESLWWRITRRHSSPKRNTTVGSMS